MMTKLTFLGELFLLRISSDCSCYIIALQLEVRSGKLRSRERVCNVLISSSPPPKSFAADWFMWRTQEVLEKQNTQVSLFLKRSLDYITLPSFRALSIPLQMSVFDTIMQKKGGSVLFFRAQKHTSTFLCQYPCQYFKKKEIDVCRYIFQISRLINIPQDCNHKTHKAA